MPNKQKLACWNKRKGGDARKRWWLRILGGWWFSSYKQLSITILLRCISLVDSIEEKQEESLCLPSAQDLSLRINSMDGQEESLSSYYSVSFPKSQLYENSMQQGIWQTNWPTCWFHPPAKIWYSYNCAFLLF